MALLSMEAYNGLSTKVMIVCTSRCAQNTLIKSVATLQSTGSSDIAAIHGEQAEQLEVLAVCIFRAAGLVGG